MESGWIVVSHDRHCDDEYWVCFEREDALAIAEGVTLLMASRYGAQNIDRQCCGNQMIYRASVEDGPRVYVIPQQIRVRGERDVSGA